MPQLRRMQTKTPASSFVLRTPRRSIKKQAAKAATRSVLLIGSHFGVGNDLLKRVFGELVSLRSVMEESLASHW